MNALYLCVLDSSWKNILKILHHWQKLFLTDQLIQICPKDGNYSVFFIK